MEGTAYLQGRHICLPCSTSSRKLLAYDPPPQPPGKAGSWAFGIISYFINGLNSHSWGQLEGLLDLIMLEREAARNASRGQERGSRERTSKQEGDVMGYESCYPGWGAETIQPPRETTHQFLSQAESKGDSGLNPFPGRLWEASWVYTTLMSTE